MHMLVATGGAQHSTFALWVANELATPTTEVTVLCVAHSAYDRARAEQVAEQARTLWLSDQVHINTHVRVGRPGEEIVRMAEAGAYDLIILGERSPHRMLTRVLGSVVAHVATNAPCPVLIAKGARSPRAHILICDSGGSRPSIATLFGRYEWVCRWAAETDVTVLHIMSQITAGPGVRGKQLQADAAGLIADHTPEGTLLARDLAFLQNCGVNAAAKVRHGLVLEEILAEVNAGDYGLIVIGAHRRAGWQGYLLTDLSQQIIGRSQYSVLLLR